MDKNSVEFTVIKAARLVDGTGAPPLERAAILIQGGDIKEVGTEETIRVPDGAIVQEIKYDDQTILPGLIDCHVHLIGFGDGRVGDDLATLPDEVLSLQAARNARTHLYSGVTTVRDCGAKNKTTFMLRQAMNMGITPGPRLILTGRPMAIVGGHLSYFGIEATGEIECRAVVRQLIKEGADFIKITATGGSTMTSFPTRPSFTVEELRAIVDEAHKFGKHAAAHCASTQGMINVLDAGIDTIIHGYHRDSDGTFRYDPKVSDRIARQGVFLNPTLHPGRRRIRDLEDKLESEGLTEFEQLELEDSQRSHDVRVSHVSKMIDAGVRLVCGSDSAWGVYQMGDFQGEIDAHVEAGLSASEAIVSATNDSARSCWIDTDVGTISAGKKADLLVVDGDPTQEIAALKSVVDVFQSGELVDRGNYV